MRSQVLRITTPATTRQAQGRASAKPRSIVLTVGEQRNVENNNIKAQCKEQNYYSFNISSTKISWSQILSPLKWILTVLFFIYILTKIHLLSYILILFFKRKGVIDKK